MNTLTMGLQVGDKFEISFEYYAHGRLYTGEFRSSIAVAQNEQIDIRYNPLRPAENSYSDSARSHSGAALIAAGVTGSIALSLIWLGLLHGCN